MSEAKFNFLAALCGLVVVAIVCATFIIISTVNADKSRRELNSCFASAQSAHEIRVCQGYSS